MVQLSVCFYYVTYFNQYFAIVTHPERVIVEAAKQRTRVGEKKTEQKDKQKKGLGNVSKLQESS